MFWRGVAFLEGACSVLEGCDKFGGALAVCWRGVANLEGRLRCFRGALAVFLKSVLQDNLQCFIIYLFFIIYILIIY